jgi:hypothetical protein
MHRIALSAPARHWRIVLAVASLLLFALAGSADDPMPG